MQSGHLAIGGTAMGKGKKKGYPQKWDRAHLKY
jgi:hypothetical protein